MTKTFGFVVLNYKNYEEAICCIDSILAISDSNYHVVVVDNDSPNDSFEVLERKYAGHPKIDVMRSGRNGGYSFGNNCGIAALAAMGIHDVIIATSDTVVLSKDILGQLARLDAPGLGVVGPNVVNLRNEQQSPMLAALTLRYVLNIHAPAVAALLRNSVYALRRLLGKTGRIGAAGSVPATNTPVYMIHGCFLYLSSHYLQKCGKLDESLFMYGEEDLLAFNCSAAGLTTLYAPGISVLHKEAMSTPSGNGNAFFSVNSKQSIRYLRSRMPLVALLRDALGRAAP